MSSLLKILSFALFIGILSCNNTSEKTADSQTFEFSPNVLVLSDLKQAKDLQPIDSSKIKIPEEMILVNGGLTLIGSDDGLPQEKPTFWVQIKPFLMDKSPVTVAQFREFIKATGFKTEAEKFGNAGYLDETEKKWILKDGANWEYPQGKGQSKAPDNHPVTQVSWNDAVAYAKWAGKRLPTEFEFEHAARNARNDRSNYPFGDELEIKGKPMANTWNGIFPEKDAVTDGFHRTSPVGHYGKTPIGLTDMTGNVWEWCDNWKLNYTDILKGDFSKTSEEKAQRGGSYLCEPTWCHGYRVSGRSGSTPDTSLPHVGFRCVKDIF
ncbi:MAG: formylglycine-generating enzyme family protein [Spirosomataceae bacterium]